MESSPQAFIPSVVIWGWKASSESNPVEEGFNTRLTLKLHLKKKVNRLLI